jgi:hemin uptake protein HemP
MNMTPPLTELTGSADARQSFAQVSPEWLADSPQSASRSSRPRTLDSQKLLGEQSMVLIRHLGEIYRLQTTRQGKLILTK